MTEEQKDYIRANYKEMTQTDIARYLGLSLSCVQRYLRRIGAPKTRAAPLPADIRDKIISLYPDYTNAEISAMLGVPVMRVEIVAHKKTCPRKTKETMRRMFDSRKREQYEKMIRTKKARNKAEVGRLKMGLPQKTKVRISVNPEFTNARNTLILVQTRHGYIRVGRTELASKGALPKRNKYNLKYIDMRHNAPILIFRGRDKDGDKYEGVLVPTPDGLVISWSEDGETFTSDIIVPESVEHVRTEYIKIKYPLE